MQAGAPPQEPQGVFNREFGGLSLASSSKSLPPNVSPVFHNCDVSADGAVIRRGGTFSVSTTDLNSTSGVLWVESMKTKTGSEYLVFINDGGITVSLMRDNVSLGYPTIAAEVPKGSIWSVTPSSVCVIPTTAPYDRLLVLTPEHPIVQVSFLERTLSFTCTTDNGGGNFTLTAPSSPNDSTLWRDNVASNYIVTNESGTVFTVTQKDPGFVIRLNGGFTVGQSYTLTIRQITWQWWAEALYWEGADFMQTVNRYNVTTADVAVKVPDRLITDLNPIYKNSQVMGLYAYASNDFTSSFYAGPLRKPTTNLEYGFSTGAWFNAGVASNELTVAPFFCTFGATQSTGVVSQLTFLRTRELRFNGGTGAKPNDLQVYQDNAIVNWTNTFPTANSYTTYAESFTATDRVLAFNSLAGDAANTQQYFTVARRLADVPFTTPIHTACLAASTYFPTSRRVWYRDLPTGGGNLNGCYVRAYGIGKYVDYSKRSFHALGTIYRDRLILVNPNTAQDQVLISEIGDSTVPGEFYQFFQITDALQGLVSDPFTLNVTNETRETITACVGWQDNVFVFTNSNTYAIAGGEQFGESSYAVERVSTYGAFNQNCVVVTNFTILYMNRFGIFDLMNKPSSESYGSFERSVAIRRLFNNDIVPASLDDIHWLRYNESTNKLYVGIGVNSDTQTTTRNLVLNLTWNAWSTISSAVPFLMYRAAQVFRYTIIVAAIAPPRYVGILAADMPYYLDWVRFNVTDTYPYNVVLPQLDFTATADARGMLRLPVPLVPGFNDYTAPGCNKIVASLVRTDGLPTNTLVTPRNVVPDYATTLPLVGGDTTPGIVGVVNALGNPYAGYARLSASAFPAPNQYNLTQVNGFDLRPFPNSASQSLYGVLYQSIYASPVFDLEAMGRLKRLKKLHLQFDTTITEEARYPVYNSVRILNAAYAVIVSNYNENISNVTVEAIRESIALDAVELDTPVETRETLQRSIPLQGYGCDYQFYVASVGAEAFKLSSYEFEVTPQRDKRYIGR